MLGFKSRPCSDFPLPQISQADERILTRFVELFGKYGDTKLLNNLIQAAYDKKLDFSETSVRFWAPLLVKGRLGPLEPLISHSQLEEIMVNDLEKPIFIYHRKEGMLKTGLSISSPAYFLELSNRMLSNLGRRVDYAHPKANGMLKSGDRVTVIIPPYSRTHVLDIRRFSVSPLTILDLVNFGMLTFKTAAFLWLVMEAGNINLGIAGNTGSGKTTLLNALTRFLPFKERVVLVEEVPEVKPLQEQVVHMVSVDFLNITLRDAIIDSLRLRPGRVIVGEVRSDEEVMAARDSCLAGQALGTYFTYHAQSFVHAEKRLKSQGFGEYDLEAIDLWVLCKRFEKKGKSHRKVVDVIFQGRPLFFGNKSPRIPELTRVFGNWKKEQSKREKILRDLTGKDEHLFKTFQEVMS
ncbi:MAG: CpaF family protein [Candidatus Altiarchaeota archaeon]|nr:CpaF family protein [Candidatus Altiarchaeota archaeon]